MKTKIFTQRPCLALARTRNLTLALALTLTSSFAHALAEGYAGVYRQTSGRHCMLNAGHFSSAHTLKISRTHRGVELNFQYDDKPSEPEVLKFVYGQSKPSLGGGQLQSFITAPRKNILRLSRTETDYRNHPVQVYTIDLQKTTEGMKLTSVSRVAPENSMSCTYKLQPKLQPDQKISQLSR